MIRTWTSAALVISASIASGQGAFSIVKEGQPSATVNLPANADPASWRAAEILVTTIGQMTGAKLAFQVGAPLAPNQIEIGFTPDKIPNAPRPAKPLANDGFYDVLIGNQIAIFSGGGKGAVYGAVHLLEQLGCRYISPIYRLFPKQSTLSVDKLNDEENPVNTFRCVNGLFSDYPDYLDWQHLDKTSDMYADGYYVHTFGKLVPPSQYFSSHPEYFALVEGHRRQEQLCPSNPALVDIIVNKLKAEMALQPDKKVWCVSQNDNTTYCHCPDCERVIQEEGSPAGPLIRLVNEVAKHFPDKTIATLAYQFSRSAPKVTTPASNVMVMLCTIEVNRSMPIESDPTSQDFVKDIKDWSKICSNLYLWDYTVNFSNFVSPLPNLHVLGPNIQFFDKYGVRRIFEQSNTGPGHEFSELKNYLLAKLLWNPDVDVSDTIEDFDKGYYGAAAPYIRAYQDKLETECQKSQKRLDIYEPPTMHADDFLGSDQVAAYNRFFDSAMLAVISDPALLIHVREAKLPLQYAELEIAANDIYGPRGFFKLENGKPVPREEMTKILEDFKAGCEACQVQTLNESGLTPEGFVEAMHHLTDLQIDGNLAFNKRVLSDPPPSDKYAHGDLGFLTNGVLGGNDYHIQWLGWEGTDFDVTVDLGSATSAKQASLNTLYVPNSWVLHPKKVSCFVSADGQTFLPAGEVAVEGDQQKENLIKNFSFHWTTPGVRYVKLHFDTMKVLPAWHSAAGGGAWVFVDEIVVR
jgi:hypothetical protein